MNKLATMRLPIIAILITSVSCVSHGNTSVSSVFQSLNGEPVIPFTANRIYMALFSNKTTIPHFEERIAKRVAEKIIANGRLALATSQLQSDLQLIGQIQLLQIQPIVVDSSGLIKKKRLLIIAVIDLFNTKTNRFIFKNVAVQAFKEYSDIEYPITPFNMVLEEVEQMLASRIALQVETGWYTSLKSDVEKGKR